MRSESPSTPRVAETEEAETALASERPEEPHEDAAPHEGLPTRSASPSRQRPEDGDLKAAAPPRERQDLPLSLAEQWGLLGLLVGLLVALGGSGFLGDMVDFDLDLDALGAGLQAMVQPVQEFFASSGAGEEVGELEAAASVASIGAGVLDLSLSAREAAQELPEVEAAAMEVSSAAAAAEASVGSLLGSSSASSLATGGLVGALGAAGGYAGLLAEASQEPTSARKEGGPFVKVGEFTPGTTAEGPTRREDRPMSAFQLGLLNFAAEWEQLRYAARFLGAKRRRHVPRFVFDLVLSNEAVLERERKRPEVPTPGPVRVAYDVLCWFIDVVFEDRPIQRFWFLETVARMPYFAYTSVLHLYETLGWWRSPELRAVHAAEEDNELHHLLIMESLGGDQRWLDRFFAQHGAIAYYWLLVLFFVVDPKWSYNFSRLIEAHAVDTYGEFVDANEELLKTLPPPPIAVEYYLSADLYQFDKFQTALRGKVRRPPCYTLYDVFNNICDDEEQHVLTMEACEEWVAGGEPAVPLGFNMLSEEEFEQRVSIDPAGRAAWLAWGKEVQAAARDAARQ